MDVGDVLITILIGAGIGILGRLVVPGRQPIGFILTILIGIGAAFAGTWLADVLDVGNTAGFDWIEFGIQVAVAAVAVAIVSAIMPNPERQRRARARSRERERD